MREQMLDALIRDAESKIILAKLNVKILLNNPVGVGDHPHVMETIQGQLDIMSQNKDRIRLEEDFYDKD
jgi:hypothetical protein